MSFRRIAAPALLMTALVGGGCGPTMRAASSEVPKAATPALADATLKVLEDVPTRERIAHVLGTPEMQRALGELSAGLSSGVVEGLSNEQLEEHLTRLVDHFTRAFFAALDEQMKGMAPSAQKLAVAVSASVVRSASAELSRSLGPAMRASMEKDVGPAFAAMLRTPEFHAAIGEASREVARQAVYGSNEALGALAAQRKHESGPLGSISAFFEGRTWLLAMLGISAAFAIALVWLIKERAAARRYHELVERKSAETAALVRALEATGEGAISRDVLAILKKQIEPELRGEKRERPSRSSGRHHA